jgi:hypothetical protein
MISYQNMDWGKRQIKSVGENMLQKDRMRIENGVPPLPPSAVVEWVDTGGVEERPTSREGAASTSFFNF